MKTKKRILLNWDVTRKDLCAPFVQLAEHFEFVIIWFSEPSSMSYEHPFREIYFQDYPTPYRLLKKIKPDAVLFFNVDSFPQVALNLAARNKGIPTFTMHHGIYTSNSLELNLKKEQHGISHKKAIWKNSFSTLFFYLSALRPKNVNQLSKYLYFPFVRKTRNSVVALEQTVFEARIPTKLIQLSPHNAIRDKQLNHLTSDERFIYIGHPFFDDVLQRLTSPGNEVAPADKYYLLIDFPNISSSIAFRSITKEGKHNFYRKLSSIAKSVGCRLKVKLHPAGFNSPDNYEDENIELIYTADIVPLIQNAAKCFSFYSTLVIPIILAKKFCYLFDTGVDIALQKELEDLGVARLLDPKTFDDRDLETGAVNAGNGYQVFIDRYLHIADGRSTERLGEVLNNAGTM